MPITTLTLEQVNQQLKVSKDKRERYWQRVQKAHDLVKDLDDPIKKGQFLIRCQSIDETREEFETVQN